MFIKGRNRVLYLYFALFIMFDIFGDQRNKNMKQPQSGADERTTANHQPTLPQYVVLV